MNKYEGAVISAFTGFLIGSFSDMHEYIEKILERPVMTHELASKDLANLIKEKSKNDFIKISEEIK